MEDSFIVRVNKTFNSLSSPSTSQTPTPSPSLWCLTDDEIERRSWAREPHLSTESQLPLTTDTDDDDDDDDCPFPSSVDRLMSSFNGKFKPDDDVANPNPNLNPDPNTSVNGGVSFEEMEKDLEELDDDDEEEKDEDRGGGNEEDEVLDVRNSIGLDPTLDFEEEEDEHDKVAVGREKSGDRLYMSDVHDYLPDFYSNGEVPSSFKEVSRDPRANHLAATLRLKEDAEAARSFNSLQVSEPNETPVSDTQHNTSEHGSNLKSILKRKEDQMDSNCEQPKEDHVGSKSEKRVRFEPSCKNSDDESGGDTNVAHEHCSSGEIILHKGPSSQNRDSSSVPDYIRNPGRYTHYTFDSSTDMNEASNRQAYMDFLNIIKKSKQSDPEEVPADLSKPVIFNPKKKASQDSMESTSNESDLTKEMAMKEHSSRKTLAVSFVSESMQEDEACEMEVDKPLTIVTKVGTGQRTTRRYRSKPGLESDESDT